MEPLYYRRVWQWMGSTWQIVKEGYVRVAGGVFCTFPGAFDAPTFCSLAPPYVFERWWKWSPHTFGTGGQWDWAAERHNYGTEF